MSAVNANGGSGVNAPSHNNSLNAIICPSILSSDFSLLGPEGVRMFKLGADWLHVDVMDGHFVPNLTLGPVVLKGLRKYLSEHLPAPAVNGNAIIGAGQNWLDVHLMVTNPRMWINEFHKAGANSLTFHIEADHGGPTIDLIKDIKSLGLKVGIALKPVTPLSQVLPFINDVDLILIMTVEPGFGGQPLIPSTIAKIRELRGLYPNLNIEVDGGITLDTIQSVSEVGANVIVSGTGIFGQKGDAKVQAAILGMRNVVTGNLKM